MGKFSDVLMDHFSSPRNVGRLEGADRVGCAGSVGRGPFMVLYLRLEAGRVTEARHQSHGCGVTIACGSMLTELIKDRTVQQCSSLRREHLIDALGGVPPDKLHCPALAIAALQAALNG